VDAKERAGLLSPQQARDAKQAIITRALTGGYGPLSEREIWAVLGDQRDLAGSLDNLTSAIDGLRQDIQKQLQAGDALLAMESAQLWKAIADIVSGQIVGSGYLPRSQSAGAGVVTRY
jgi:hypothetical protein